jgi:hypothetical protein
MSRSILAAVCGMVSGQCKWIGREDIHVYCHAPMVERLMPTGRMGWQPGPATYSIACPSAGLDAETWTTAADVARQIESILTMEAAA